MANLGGHPVRGLPGGVPQRGDEAGVEIEEREELNDHLNTPQLVSGCSAVV